MAKKKRKVGYFDSQASAAAALGIEISLIRDAKREGCPAFKSGRVYKRELLRWLREKKAKAAAPPAKEHDDGNLPKSHWDREKARADYERAVFNLEMEKKKYVLLDEICAAVGQMLTGFRTAINMLPASAARWLIGLKDFHVIKSKLQSEVDSVLNSLGRGRYLEDLAPTIIEKLFSDHTAEFRQDVAKCCAQVFIEIGRESLKELQIDVGEPQA